MDVLRELGAKWGIERIDLDRRLAQELDDEAKWQFFIDDFHFNVRGHALVADILHREHPGLID